MVAINHLNEVLSAGLSSARFEAAKAFGSAIVSATPHGSPWPDCQDVAEEAVKYGDMLLAELGRTGEGVGK
jgi:hypothetical protein